MTTMTPKEAIEWLRYLAYSSYNLEFKSTTHQVADLLEELTAKPPAPAQFVPHQLCPKCNGSGVNVFDSGRIQDPSPISVCDLCNGAKVTPQHKLN